MSNRSSKHSKAETRGGLPSLSSLSTSLMDPAGNDLLETLSSVSPFDPMSWRALLALCATEKTTLHQWCTAEVLYDKMQTGGFTICPETSSWREKMNTLSPFVGMHKGRKHVVGDRALVAIALSHCLRTKEEGIFAVGSDKMQTIYNKYVMDEKHDYFRKCKGLWKDSLRIDGLILSGADDWVCMDKELVMEAIKQNGLALTYGDLDHRDFLLRAVTANGLAFVYLVDATSNEYDFQLAAAYGMHHQLHPVWQDDNIITPLIKKLLIQKLESGLCLGFKETGDDLVTLFVQMCADVIISAELATQFGDFVEAIAKGTVVDTTEPFHVFASYCLLNCKPMVLALAAQTILPFELFDTPRGRSMDLATDADIAMAQVRLNGNLLERFKTKFSNNKPIVIEAVRRRPAALAWASEDIKDDEYVVSTAAVRDFSTIEKWASDRLKGDKVFVGRCRRYGRMYRRTALLHWRGLQRT